MRARTIGARLKVQVAIRLRKKAREGVGQRMAEAAKGINPQITPEEVTEEVKEATAEVVDKLRANKGAQLVSLRETVSSEGFDEKRGWRRIMAVWGSTNSPFYR
jgi:DNA-directed RNA polymerase specialized sigma subunit